ncbi:hypothetical protein BJ322DRAFT_1219896 [Thelephora terrestris]|uniref:NACHT domain-containing protein n=1 Tax=Thelephora terrestris TaxID=56493 RepID=A0A9P6HBM6_9AGAM|nr:hypothetical protein BJ322DRAFT_1219896 [Thelephora terrestris]
MSTILRKRPPSSGGTPIVPSSSKKRRFIDVVKALLDIAKESSDAFPPLKSCLGGINALIKHYEECADVRDKLNDLIPWLGKLTVTLAKVNPEDDDEEIRRRSDLASSLEDIEKRSLALSGKGKVARVLDKSQDSGEVVRLVEKLRQAILVYQVSQQQSIYNQIAHLTAYFGARLKLDQTSTVKNKIESVLARLNRFDVEGNTTANDESKRHKTLFEALEGIKDRLQLLSECPSTNKEGDITTVCDLADDLRDAIAEYQLAQQNAIFEQNRKLIDAGQIYFHCYLVHTHGSPAELLVLNDCHRASGADFRHGDRRGCLKGTRTTILDEIELWSVDFDMPPVYWLNGLAGTGKSTIAQTIAEHIFADGRLGASFFCSRDFNDRRSLHYIFPTIAFQLAHKYSEFRSILIPLLQSNPDIGHESLFSQMRMLIAEPLSSLSISTVIVIDALDECVDDDPQSAILSVMGRLVGEIPSIKFFITGRPEPRIQSGFRLGLLRPFTDIFVLHDVEPTIINTDIRLFLKHGLSKVAKRRNIGQDGWPTDDHLDLLSGRAAGLFVYAVATLKFLDHSFTSPTKQLDVILRAPGNTTYEGKAKLQSSTTLDSLYLSCFEGAFDGMSSENDETVRSVVGLVVLAMDPLPPSAIATLVNLGEQEVVDLLRLIQSLLKFPEDANSPVLPFHKSFPDFITSTLRCPNERFLITPRTAHLKITLSCLELMNVSLQQNPLSIPSYALNSEVKGLKERARNEIDYALQYACKFWYCHLMEAREGISDIFPALQSFLQERFLAWLEVLSVLGCAKEAVVALETLMHWVQKVTKDYQLLNTARDYFQFATTFFDIIDVSATHIYHSALELSPLSSIVRKFYYSQRPHSSPRVIEGIPNSWQPSIASVSTKHSHQLSSAWSPCGQVVAVVFEEAAEIRDALSLKLLSTLQLPEGSTRFKRGLAYSPDGCFLASCSNTAIIIWDVQTGGAVKKIEFGAPGDCVQLAWSLNGEKVAIVLRVAGTLAVHMYQIASSAIQLSSSFQHALHVDIWAYNESFRILVIAWERLGRSRIVNIFEVGSALVKIEPLTFKSVHELGVFSPATNRISTFAVGKSSGEGTLFILDICSSKVLLQAVIAHYVCCCFSPDGTLFAASFKDSFIIWKYTSGQYAQWGKFMQGGLLLQFSPTSSSIFGNSGSILHVFHLDYSPAANSSELVSTTHTTQLDAFPPSGTYIATAHQHESTVTITNLCSQVPSASQFIDTGLNILAMALTGNVLLVRAPETVVAWLLTEAGTVDGSVDNRRASQKNMLWKKSLLSHISFFPRIFEQGDSRDDDVTTFTVKDAIAAVWHNKTLLCVYHTKTGEILGVDERPWGKEYHLHSPHKKNESNTYHHDSMYKHSGLLEGDQPISQATLQDGWVKDEEGKHQLWLYPDWRSSKNEADWLYNVSTLRLRTTSQLVIVKF